MIIFNVGRNNGSLSVSQSMVDSNSSSSKVIIGTDLTGESINEYLAVENYEEPIAENAAGVLISGSAGDDILVSFSGNDTLEGKEGKDLLSGLEGSDSLAGGLSDDTLTGGGVGFKDDIIFVTSDTSGIDTLTGGEGSDLFVLGGKSQPELKSNSDSIVHYDRAGNDDYAIVTDFNSVEDRMMLGASRNNYSLVNLPTSQELYYNDELIAVLEGNTTLNLEGSYFQFPDSAI